MALMGWAYTRATMVGDRGDAMAGKAGANLQSHLQFQIAFLQLECMKVESPSNPRISIAAVNYVPGPCTHRPVPHTMGVGFTRSRLR